MNKVKTSKIIFFSVLMILFFLIVFCSTQRGEKELLQPKEAVSKKEAFHKKNNFSEERKKLPSVSGEVHSQSQMLALRERMIAISSRRDGVDFDDGMVQDAVRRENLWEVVSGSVVVSGLSLEDVYDGREFIRFDALKVETLIPGDNIRLYIPQAQREYTANIRSVIENGGGVITWEGEISGTNNKGKVSITKDLETTYIGLFTEDAHYTVEAKGDIGWIANSGTLFKHDGAFIPVVDNKPEEVVFPSKNYLPAE